jgi:hypothetical protein
MNLECFTAREIAEVINELGFKAKIITEDGTTKIESASSGATWSVWLGDGEPFFDLMQLCTTVWVYEDPFQWASNWNRRHCWSMAHVYVPEDDSPLLPDEDGEYAVFVGFAYDFSSGVSEKYLEIGFSRWLETIEEIVQSDEVRTIPAQNFHTN